jgi:hypothetical protein
LITSQHEKGENEDALFEKTVPEAWGPESVLEIPLWDFLSPDDPDSFPLRNQNFPAAEAMSRAPSFVILEEWRNSD